MNSLRSVVNKLLIEKGGKKSNLDKNTYYFISPTFVIKDKNSGYKYTVAKVKTKPDVCLQVYRYDLDSNPEYFEIEWKDFNKNYETV
tara:strand:- start:939 stop:1199 length:261 start_codon:yes stop_codon:yes gene_type:complete